MKTWPGKHGPETQEVMTNLFPVTQEVMTNLFPVTHIKVTYEEAPAYTKKDVPDAIWQYRIEEADGNVYGFAGGLLSKTTDNLWKAYYWNYVSGEPAKTRKQAILNVLPLAAKIVIGFNTQRAEYEKIYAERCAFANSLFDKFKKKPSRTVSVFDTTAERSKPSGEPLFQVTMVFDNLTSEQINKLVEAE